MRTTRLLLVPLAPPHILALIDAPERFAAAFGYRAADGLRDFYTSGEVSPAWIDGLRRSSQADPWVYGFALVDSTGQVIGAAGFKGAPGPDGVVEIAYGVVPGSQGQGLATEAAEALTRFALDDPRVHRVLAHTLPERNASSRVLQNCGFSFVGEVLDPEDGPVWRWERLRTAG